MWSRRSRIRRADDSQITPQKRLFDIGLAVLLLVPVGLVCMVVAALLLLVQGRPVLHRSLRMADMSRSFVLWKFRTMMPDEHDGDDGGVSGGHKEHRVTRVGAVLRACRVDELPQLWNILYGEMSFVGPRPPLPSVVLAHPAIYRDVLQVRPGVTGLASVVYHRHEERLMAQCRSAADAARTYSCRCIPAKARLDDIYSRNRSLPLDLAILGQTLIGICGGRHLRRAVRHRKRTEFAIRLTKPKVFVADDPTRDLA